MKNVFKNSLFVALMVLVAVPQTSFGMGNGSNFTSVATQVWANITSSAFLRDMAVSVSSGLIVVGIVGFVVIKVVNRKAEEVKKDIKNEIDQQMPLVMEKAQATYDEALKKFDTIKTDAIEKYDTIKIDAVAKYDEALKKFDTIKIDAVAKFDELKVKVQDTYNDVTNKVLYPVNIVVDPIKRALDASKRLASGIKKDAPYALAVLGYLKEFSFDAGKEAMRVAQQEFDKKSQEYEEIGQDAGKALEQLQEKSIAFGDTIGEKLGDTLEYVESCITQ